ncbi:MAG: DUF4091 domain-containing protein [Bacillota bacterium]|nr:DUF4091 domain-containing protein [Bacillota bacterium]
MARLKLTNQHPSLEVSLASSLYKPRPDGSGPAATPPTNLTVLRGERWSCQLLLDWSGHMRQELEVTTTEPDGAQVTVRTLDYVPVRFATYGESDDNYLSTAPGLFPDPLLPLENNRVFVAPRYRVALWIDVEVDADCPAGDLPLEIALHSPDGRATAALTLEVMPVTATAPDILHTEWFHADTIADYYGYEVFSEEHWQALEAYMALAAKRSINLLLTPLFTPPLDTAVGHERTTVQLIGVREPAPGQWEFNFDGLERWVTTARRAGIENFELCHLFTQWGAAHAPKVMVTHPDGSQTRRFGWETDACGDDWRAFLTAFLPQLVAWLDAHELRGRAIFHISDEPQLEHLPAYQAARDLVVPLVDPYPIMDALSDFAFFQKGIVKQPVVASDHVGPFLEADVKGLWTYYCCAQHKGVANRFIAMPSGRARILGAQLFRYDFAGFLHWGYNFYNRQYSLGRIDPWRVNDAGLGFPGGDAFVVYPGPDGTPYDSLRQMLTADAFADLAALQQLAAHRGHGAVIDLMTDVFGADLTMIARPEDQDRLEILRERVNRELALCV